METLIDLEYLRSVGHHEAEGDTQRSQELWRAPGTLNTKRPNNGLAFADDRILIPENLVNQAVTIDEVHGTRDTVEVGFPTAPL